MINNITAEEPALLAVEDCDCGKRIDSFIAEKFGDMSRSAVQKAVENGEITVNDSKVAKNYKLRQNDSILIRFNPPEEILATPQNIPIKIVYEDNDIIVVNKDRGMVVHPAPGNPDGTLVNALLFHCGNSLSGINGEIRPGIVHRIDKDTSGLIVVAKNDAAHKSLSEQIKEHSAGRIYHAVVHGHLKQPSGSIAAPIGRCPTDRKKMAVVPGGRFAVTHYSTIAEYPGFTYIECRLETGRTHQIRVHFSSIGHPLAGDIVYGSAKHPALAGGQCLHAFELHLVHPASGVPMTFHADLPEYFTDFLNEISPKTTDV